MLSSTLEAYLVVVYNMGEQGEEVKCSEVAKTLKVPIKKVVQAMQRMHYQKYIVYSPYQPLKITEKGEKAAKYLISRNELIEEFLEILKITENSDAEREAMQQYLSWEALEMIEKFVLFHRQYPEIGNKYNLFIKRNPKTRLLQPIDEDETR